MKGDLVDKKILSQLRDIEVCKTPFSKIAKGAGISEVDLISRIRGFIDKGIIRGFRATLHHEMLGYKGNAMVVWCVPGDQVNDVGEILASFPQVSHCYERHVPQGWRFNLFTMIHTPDRASAKALIRTMSDRVGIDDYCVFFTKSELKKEGMAYIKDG